MAIDFDAVRAGLEQAIPFNGHLGLEVVAVSEGSGSVRLPDDPNLLNHVGSQHAGALFTAGEAASGAAFVGAFLERMGEITPLAKSASIDYRKVAKGSSVSTPTAASSSRSTSPCATPATSRSPRWPSPGTSVRTAESGSHLRQEGCVQVRTGYWSARHAGKVAWQ
jgi:acyl-coenzyme A thioesterase PaaI-like protein